MNFIATHKEIVFVYDKNGNEKPVFDLVSKTGQFKKIPPRQFKYNKLPNKTSEANRKKLYNFIIRKMNKENFGGLVDFNIKVNKLKIQNNLAEKFKVLIDYDSSGLAEFLLED